MSASGRLAAELLSSGVAREARTDGAHYLGAQKRTALDVPHTKLDEAASTRARAGAMLSFDEDRRARTRRAIASSA